MTWEPFCLFQLPLQACALIIGQNLMLISLFTFLSKIFTTSPLYWQNTLPSSWIASEDLRVALFHISSVHASTLTILCCQTTGAVLRLSACFFVVLSNGTQLAFCLGYNTWDNQTWYFTILVYFFLQFL